jgi:hypothetical protein
MQTFSHMSKSYRVDALVSAPLRGHIPGAGRSSLHAQEHGKEGEDDDGGRGRGGRGYGDDFIERLSRAPFEGVT